MKMSQIGTMCPIHQFDKYHSKIDQQEDSEDGDQGQTENNWVQAISTRVDRWSPGENWIRFCKACLLSA